MPEMTSEKFAQRVFDLDLVDSHQLESIWGEFGSRDITFDRFAGLMVRRELLTNFQVDRIVQGKREGYFYGAHKVLYMVGSGTFARVYRAVHRETGRVRAVKVLRKRYSDDLVTTAQFLREATMVMPLRHPNIVPVFDVLEDSRRPFMVMEFVEGQNLRDFIKARKHLELLVSLRLTADVLAGLDYAIRKNVTHRDMKLSNVLISSHGRAKLVDFGLAAISADMTEEAIAAAPNPRSIDYAGLERITGVRKNDPRSDLYFAGCMLYHMIGGRPPLFETRDRIKRLSVSRYREIKPLGQLVPDLPNFVIALINRAMELKVERRFQTPAEMLKQLNTAIGRIEAGDTGATMPSGNQAQPIHETASPDDTPLEREGEPWSVMLVESNVEMQNAVRSALKKHGYRMLVISSTSRALQRFAEADPTDRLADCVIFSAGELGDTAVDAFNQFGESEETKHIPAICLVRRANKDHIRRASVSDHRILLPLGLKIKQLRAKLVQLLSEYEPSQS